MGIGRSSLAVMMHENAEPRAAGQASLRKVPTGIRGLDDITLGGFPYGRTTLVCGGAGSGKTLLGMEFLVRGATEFGEPGVFISFEEKAEELEENVASLGFDLHGLISSNLMAIDHVYVDRSEIEETGEYDLEGLFVRLGCAIDSIGAKRIVIDTLEALFSAFNNEAILRAELRRLFRWLKDRKMTAVITGERGSGTLTRHGLEEYVSDCVIVLDQRVHERVATRHLRVVKYRGTSHGTNEYPFLIDGRGISVLPITSIGLLHKVSDERMPTGVAGLDAMLENRGFYRGSSVLISGTSGTGKTSLSAHTAHAAVCRGERCLYLAFEESQGQFVRNMRSIGLDFQPFIDAGLFRFRAARPTMFGLEMHLATIHSEVDEFEPSVVVIDPLTNFITVGSQIEVRSMLMRLVDFLKNRGVTAIFTTLTAESVDGEWRRWAYRRWWTPGCSFVFSREAGNEIVGCTCSSRVACHTRIRFVSFASANRVWSFSRLIWGLVGLSQELQDTFRNRRTEPNQWPGSAKSKASTTRSSVSARCSTRKSWLCALNSTPSKSKLCGSLASISRARHWRSRSGARWCGCEMQNRATEGANDKRRRAR